MSNDDSLPPKICNCEACLLCLLAILEYDLNLLHDGSVLIQSSIDIMDWAWVWLGAGFQLVLLPKGTVDDRSCFTRSKNGRFGDILWIVVALLLQRQLEEQRI